jgi:acyl-coenzyme A thioesterase PaaI-like protein
VVHGGIITLVLEEVAQWTIISHFGKFGMTREISVRYLKPVPTNMEILVEAEIVNQNEKCILFRCTVHNSAGVLLTESESDWIFASPSTIAKATAVDESMLREFLSKYSQ